jgi:hypothetical protein
MATKASLLTNPIRILKKDWALLRAHLCAPCAFGKLTFAPVRRKPLAYAQKRGRKPAGEPRRFTNLSADDDTDGPGKLVVMDLLESPIASYPGGALYALLITDSASAYTWSYFLKTKDQAADRIGDWFHWLDRNKTKVSAYTTVRTDNGGEFVGAPFQKVLAENNVHFEAAPPYKHVHLAERTNRTIQDAARALMFAQNIRATFWTEAVATAVYVKNRLVDSRSSVLTPFERFFGHPPRIDHLRTFGCTVYAMRARDGKKKWDPRCFEGTFVGYDEDHPKSWRVWNPTTRKVVHTGDCVFNENAPKHALTDEERSELQQLHAALDNQLQDNRSRPDTSDISDDSLEDSDSEDETTDTPYPATVPMEVEKAPEDGHLVQPLPPPAPPGLPQALPQPVLLPTRTSTRQQKIFWDHVARRNEDAPPRSKAPKKKPKKKQQAKPSEPQLTPSVDRIIALRAATDPPSSKPPPSSFPAAYDGPDSALWRPAIAAEINSLASRQTIQVMLRSDLPPDGRALPVKWVFKTKLTDTGAVARYKARCTVMGNLQQEGIDYDETFSPTARFQTLRFLLAKAAEEQLIVHQMDVETAFLYGELSPEDPAVYIQLPQTYPVPDEYSGLHPKHLVGKLLKGVYGLKQSPRLWHAHLKSTLHTLGFTKADYDQCLFSKTSDSGIVYMIVYVDDLVIAASNEEVLQGVKDDLRQVYNMTDMGPLKYCLGINVARLPDGSYRMDQSTYIDKLLRGYKMTNARAAAAPLPPQPPATQGYHWRCWSLWPVSSDGGIVDVPRCVHPHRHCLRGLLPCAVSELCRQHTRDCGPPGAPLSNRQETLRLAL